ncbi:hypothetical protein QEH52_01665 [Coraliomargarita sp. SDUM461003]|uniref:Uncharacterized protein n=1 Tax=Thalassobacterium maritimum TaxID=3041265 RepID=A0ABU1ASH1_9BACT|nr:hypothetical protein [Coraliomargarita sp. SDUM461003]MDQ8206199.1 hypothetical protein [Coraliomargarita sp. SDUM461003]
MEGLMMSEGDSEFNDMSALVAQLTSGIYYGSIEREYDFWELWRVCADCSYFKWMIALSGGELSLKSRAILGKMWSGKYNGATFTLLGGQRVEFGVRGVGIDKRYFVRLVGNKAGVAVKAALGGEPVAAPLTMGDLLKLVGRTIVLTDGRTDLVRSCRQSPGAAGGSLITLETIAGDWCEELYK